MNERIQNMLDQAINAMPEHLDFDIPKELAEKFAELIVKECLVQIGNAIPDTDCSSSGPYKTARIAATSRVKEHFGVTE